MPKPTKADIARNRRKWLAALRSGKFKQGRNALKKKDGDKYLHCCLGVCLEAVAGHCPISKDQGTRSDYSKVRSLLGIDNDVRFVWANDNAGKSFRQIANMAERMFKKEADAR